jgi:hypothetical protein
LAVLFFAAPALAQTCRASAPPVGQIVSGPVLHVLDGQTLCLALGPTPDRWIALRVSPSVTPLSVDRERLMAATFSRSLRCEILGGSGAVRRAACTLDGQPLDAVLAEPATITQAKTWR